MPSQFAFALCCSREASEPSIPSISSPDAKENKIVAILSCRLVKLEQCCSNMNQKLGTVLEFLENFCNSKNIGSAQVNTIIETEAEEKEKNCQGQKMKKTAFVDISEDEDDLINIPVSELSSNHPSEMDDLLNAFAGGSWDELKDDLNDDFVDEKGQIRMIHDDVVDEESFPRFFDSHPGYSVNHFEEKFGKKGDVAGDVKDDFSKQLDVDDVEHVVGDLEKDVDVQNGGEKVVEVVGCGAQIVGVKDVVSVLEVDDAQDYMEKLDDLVDNISGEYLHIDNIVAKAAEDEIRKKKKKQEMNVKIEVEADDVQTLKAEESLTHLQKIPNTVSNLHLISSSSEGDRFSTMFDSLFEYDAHFIKPFLTWYLNPPPYLRSFKLRSYCPLKVGPWFFSKLTEKTTCLCTQTCDALLNLLLYKASSSENILLKRWIIVENWFWEYMGARNLSRSQKLYVLRYPNGSLPELYGKSWKEVDHVYGIGIIDGNHFVAYDIDIPK